MQGIVISHNTVTVEIKALILDARKTCTNVNAQFGGFEHQSAWMEPLSVAGS